MKRQGTIAAAAAVVALLGAGLLYGYMQLPANASPEYAAWRPSAAAIRGKLGPSAAPAQGMTEKVRRERFCALFKSRYRDHEPAVAVGMRFVSASRIKLMCPARLEPFLIDQIALAAWREAREIFGRPIEVDIYDTLIGTTQIKIGELRASADAPEIARIAYDFTDLEKLNRPRSAIPATERNGKLIRTQSALPMPPMPLRRGGRPVL